MASEEDFDLVWGRALTGPWDDLAGEQLRLSGRCLVLLVKHQVAVRFGARPTEQQLLELAVELAPCYDGPAPLVGTLLTAYRCAVPALEVRGVPFLESASAVLRALALDIDALREDVRQAVSGSPAPG